MGETLKCYNGCGFSVDASNTPGQYATSPHPHPLAFRSRTRLTTSFSGRLSRS